MMGYPQTGFLMYADHHLLSSTGGSIFGMLLKIFAKIDQTGHVNIFKMVLLLVYCWWWSCCFCLAEDAITNHCQASQRQAAAGDESTRQ
jgi:hypothetical protein